MVLWADQNRFLSSGKVTRADMHGLESRGWRGLLQSPTACGKGDGSRKEETGEDHSRDRHWTRATRGVRLRFWSVRRFPVCLVERGASSGVSESGNNECDFGTYFSVGIRTTPKFQWLSTAKVYFPSTLSPTCVYGHPGIPAASISTRQMDGCGKLCPGP